MYQSGSPFIHTTDEGDLLEGLMPASLVWVAKTTDARGGVIQIPTDATEGQTYFLGVIIQMHVSPYHMLGKLFAFNVGAAASSCN